MHVCEQIGGIVVDAERGLQVGVQPAAAAHADEGDSRAPRRGGIVGRIADQDATLGGEPELVERGEREVRVGLGALRGVGVGGPGK